MAEPPTGVIKRPAPRPRGVAPASDSRIDPVCNYCHSWASCCYCYEPLDAIRTGLSRLIRDHATHNPHTCDGCTRLTGALDNEHAMRRACRRLAEIHYGHDPRVCPDRQRLDDIRERDRP